ncbi:MAG: hypothetical protein H0T44_16010 [Gemmatimonadales bacterium]|nr:hypothetical protein [Gemmatimonadales bacterium]MDQ3427293.1 hypothetical protein [Gemmatimonadota bacterium]
MTGSGAPLECSTISTAPFEHHEEAEVAVAFGKENLARTDLSRMAPGGQRGQITGAEDGERDFLIAGHCVIPDNGAAPTLTI